MHSSKLIKDAGDMGTPDDTSSRPGNRKQKDADMNMKQTADIISLEDKTIAKIERYIKSPPENSRVFTITPGIAEHLLETYNEGNRRRKPLAITKYADHMAAQTWAVTGDTLKFSDENVLRDGQNRLFACIKSGVSFTTHVVFGIDDDAFDLLDQGKNRSAADVLNIASVKNPEKVAGFTKVFIMIRDNKVVARKTIEPATIREVVMAMDPAQRDAAVEVGKAVRKMFDGRWPASQVAAMYFYLLRKSADPVQVATFFEAFATGALGRVKPLKKANDVLGEMQKNSMGRVHDTARLALLVLAWNYHVQGQAGNKKDLVWRPAEKFPAIRINK